MERERKVRPTEMESGEKLPKKGKGFKKNSFMPLSNDNIKQALKRKERIDEYIIGKPERSTFFDWGKAVPSVLAAVPARHGQNNTQINIQRANEAQRREITRLQNLERINSAISERRISAFKQYLVSNQAFYGEQHRQRFINLVGIPRGREGRFTAQQIEQVGMTMEPDENKRQLGDRRNRAIAEFFLDTDTFDRFMEGQTPLPPAERGPPQDRPMPRVPTRHTLPLHQNGRPETRQQMEDRLNREDAIALGDFDIEDVD